MLSCSMMRSRTRATLMQSSQAKELSEEDRQKKEELELLVQRAQDWPSRSPPVRGCKHSAPGRASVKAGSERQATCKNA